MSDKITTLRNWTAAFAVLFAGIGAGVAVGLITKNAFWIAISAILVFHAMDIVMQTAFGRNYARGVWADD